MAQDDIQGQVVDSSGNPVSGAIVELTKSYQSSVSQQEYVQRTTTDSNGNYIFTTHPDGDGTTKEWHVSAYTYDGSAYVNSFSNPGVAADLPANEPSGLHYYSIPDYNAEEIEYYNLQSPFDIANRGSPDVTLTTNHRSSNLEITDDGNVLYSLNNGDQISPEIKKYTLSTPFDLSTATLESTTGTDIFASPSTGFDFAENGNKLYVGDSGEIQQYELSTPYDITTRGASPSATLAGTTAQGPGDPAFSPDGTKLTFGHRNDNSILSFDLSTPFDIGTATSTATFTTSDADPSCLKWNADGTTAFVRHASPDMVNEFSTTTPYSVDGMSFVQELFVEPGFAAGGHTFNYNY